MILKPQWLDRILSGEKTMELRPRRLKPGTYYVGAKGELRGQVLLGDALAIDTAAKMRSFKKRHCAGDSLPYKSTWGLPILGVRKVCCKYQHKRGAVGIVRFLAPGDSPSSADVPDVD